MEGDRFDGHVLEFANGMREVAERFDVRRLGRTAMREIEGDVFGGSLQPVERVTERVPGSPCDEDLVGADAPPLGNEARLIRSLAVTGSAVATWPSRPGHLR